MRFVKLLKWELLKRYYSLRFLLAGMIGLLLLLSIWPAPGDVIPPALSLFLMASGVLIVFASFCVIMIYPSYALASGLRNKCAPLERSRSLSFALSMAAQFLSSALIILLTSGLVLLAAGQYKKFSTMSIQFFTLTTNVSLWSFLLQMAAFFPATVLFSSVAGRSVRVLRRIAPIPTWLLFAGFLGLYSVSFHMAAPWGDLILGLVAAVAFFGACWLYEHKYEPA